MSRRLSSAFALVFMALTMLLPLRHAQSAQVANISQFPTPTKNAEPLAMTRGPDGNVWFVENAVARVAKVTSSGKITEYRLPSNALPWGITVGPDGNLWATESTTNLARITPSGQVSQFAANCGTTAITARPPDQIWYTCDRTGEIGGMTTKGTSVGDAHVSSSSMNGIAAGPDGGLWFLAGNKTVEDFSPAKNTWQSYDISNNGESITAGPDGNMWFTEYNQLVGKVTTTGKVTEYKTGPDDNDRWQGITVGADHSLGFAESGGGGQVTQLSTNGGATRFAALGQPTGVARVADGSVWYTDPQSSEVDKMTFSSSNTPRPATPAPTVRPPQRSQNPSGQTTSNSAAKGTAASSAPASSRSPGPSPTSSTSATPGATGAAAPFATSTGSRGAPLWPFIAGGVGLAAIGTGGFFFVRYLRR